MNIEQLKKELISLKIPKRYYSINGNLLSDTYILNQVYDKWECFYFDEKGHREGYKIFDREEDACQYLLENLKTEISYSTTSYKNIIYDREEKS